MLMFYSYGRSGPFEHKMPSERSAQFCGACWNRRCLHDQQHESPAIPLSSCIGTATCSIHNIRAHPKVD